MNINIGLLTYQSYHSFFLNQTRMLQVVYDDDYVIDGASEDEDDAPLSSKRKAKKSKYEEEASWDDEEVFIIDVGNKRAYYTYVASEI